MAKEKKDTKKAALPNTLKRINAIIRAAEKKFGEGAVLSGTTKINREVVSTGSVLVDVASGVGGIPLGIFAEIYGPESSGKTSLTLSIMGQAQKKGLLVGFIDAEQSLSLDWAKTLGVDLNQLLFAQPSSFEEGIEIMKLMIDNGVQFVVFDSIAAAPVAAEVRGTAGDAVIGVKARIMSATTSALLPVLKKNNATVIFINQVREKVGVMYGNPETTPGGKALKFNASMRIRLAKKNITESGTKVGDEIAVTFQKNKLAPPFKKATIRLIYGKGFDKPYELAQAAVDTGTVIRKGAYYYPTWLSDETKFLGIDRLREEIANDPEFAQTITEIIYKKLSDTASTKEEVVHDIKEEEAPEDATGEDDVI